MKFNTTVQCVMNDNELLTYDSFLYGILPSVHVVISMTVIQITRQYYLYTYDSYDSSVLMGSSVHHTLQLLYT